MLHGILLNRSLFSRVILPFCFDISDSEYPLDSITLDPSSFSEQDSIPSEKSLLLESADVKPSDLLPLPIGTEDHQILLPVTDGQSSPSDTLLRSSITGYSEPQFIFLQQLY